MQAAQGTFLSGPNAAFIEELYGRYVENPNSVDSSWQKFFAELQDDARAVLQDLKGASWAPRTGDRPANGGGNGHIAAANDGGSQPLVTNAVGQVAIRASAKDSIRVLMLIRAYRVRGHLEANLDPLGLKPMEPHADLNPRSYGFTDA
ncbi:MAG TPA: 2-oxoglutarate dehydrogenase E1 component, partial [Dongiaceae bacterium]